MRRASIHPSASRTFQSRGGSPPGAPPARSRPRCGRRRRDQQGDSRRRNDEAKLHAISSNVHDRLWDKRSAQINRRKQQSRRVTNPNVLPPNLPRPTVNPNGSADASGLWLFVAEEGVPGVCWSPEILGQIGWKRGLPKSIRRKFATMCPPCLAELPSIERLHKAV